MPDADACYWRQSSPTTTIPTPDRIRETAITSMTYRLGIDIGGTFTDLALLDARNGRSAIHKRLTTPGDPARAVLEGTVELLAQQKASMAEVETVMHGTTLITNATIERRGAVTGFLVTRGFRDVLDIGKEQRYDLFDLRIRFPDPLVPRPLRREVSERIQFDGTIETPLDDEEVRRAVAELVDEHEIEALAVGLLHSYANPAHERQIQQLVLREFPSLHLSISSDVCPFMREFERWTTTIVNAYTQPIVDRYLAALESGLKDARIRRQVLCHDVERRRGDTRYRAPLSCPLDRIGPGGGRADVELPQPASDRTPACALLRHGRDHRQRLADP